MAKEEKQEIKLKLLTTVSDFTESQMIVGLLKDEGIPVLVKDLGLGGFMKVTMGYTVFGRELYVSEADFERAAELVKAFFDRDADGGDGIKKHPFTVF
ncbi:MAG: DUF2007 domain-containing protein [Clostridia bacterium]|nr:DUF2007 domain-containing protein [Clostridia bacterium]